MRDELPMELPDGQSRRTEPGKSRRTVMHAVMSERRRDARIACAAVAAIVLHSLVRAGGAVAGESGTAPSLVEVVVTFIVAGAASSLDAILVAVVTLRVMARMRKDARAAARWRVLRATPARLVLGAAVGVAVAAVASVRQGGWEPLGLVGAAVAGGWTTATS